MNAAGLLDDPQGENLKNFLKGSLEDPGTEGCKEYQAVKDFMDKVINN